MSLIAEHLVTRGYLSLDLLNYRVAHFSYGPLEIGNKPKTPIGEKYQWKTTASEMMTLVRLFPLMVGDLIPESDEVWKFFLDLIELIDLVLMFHTSADTIDRIRELVKLHNTNFITLFTEYDRKSKQFVPVKLKPKMHLLVHYPRVIPKSGPVRNYWCFRFEAKHKEFKEYARVITSRKHICLTLAKKFQLKFAKLLMDEENKLEYSVSPHHSIKSDDNNFAELIKNHILLLDANCNSNSYHECIYRGHIYKSGDYLCEGITVDCSHTVVFRIRQIFIVDNDVVPYVVCERVEVVAPRPHYAALEISAETFSGCFQILRLNECNSQPVNDHKISSGKIMIRPKMYYV